MKKIPKQLRWWLDTDEVKAIVTIIAVLLVPAAALVWNYYSSDQAANEPLMTVKTIECTVEPDNSIRIN